MQWCVAVLIGSVGVCFALDQLGDRNTRLDTTKGCPDPVWIIYSDASNPTMAGLEKDISCLLTHSRGIVTCLILNQIITMVMQRYQTRNCD